MDYKWHDIDIDVVNELGKSFATIQNVLESIVKEHVELGKRVKALENLAKEIQVLDEQQTVNSEKINNISKTTNELVKEIRALKLNISVKHEPETKTSHYGDFISLFERLDNSIGTKICFGVLNEMTSYLNIVEAKNELDKLSVSNTAYSVSEYRLMLENLNTLISKFEYLHFYQKIAMKLVPEIAIPKLESIFKEFGIRLIYPAAGTTINKHEAIGTGVKQQGYSNGQIIKCIRPGVQDIVNAANILPARVSYGIEE